MIYHRFAQELLLELESVNNFLKIAIAISGGSDSMALCFLLKKFINEHGGELHCITIDHQLRTGSSSEAQRVNEILSQNHIQHTILPWIGPKPNSNIQEKARIARYTLLTDYCKNNNINCLATGHQKNDQAENFIMRIDHGTGLYGLSGIPKVTEFNGIKIIRPLLSFNKRELQEYLKEANINWIEDPSNLNDKYTRVKVRNILNAYPEWIDKLAAASNNLSKTKDSIEYFLNKSIKELTELSQDYCTIELSEFNNLPQEIRFRMIERILQKFSNSPKPPRGERIENLLKKIEMGEFFKASTLSGCLILRKKDKLIIKLES